MRGVSSRAALLLVLLQCTGLLQQQHGVAALSLWGSGAFARSSTWHRRLQQQQQQQQQAGSGVAAASSSRSLQRQRQQQQPSPKPGARVSSSASSSQGGVGLPMCTWNDVKEYCSPSHHVYLSIKAAPTTVLHRAAAVAYDRNLVCNGRPDEALCVNATAQRCFWWNKSCVGLDAYELVNWLGAGSQVSGDATLLAFTCPGSAAAQYRACVSATDAGAKGICNQLPGCAFVPLAKQCLPRALDSRSISEVQALTKAFNSGEPKVWGTCPGACYVRQAIACQQAYNSSSACTAKPFCVWEFDSFDSRQVCLHRDTAARGNDAFSKQYASIKDKCAALKGPAACEAPTVTATSAGKFQNAKQREQQRGVAEEAAAKCVL